MLSFQNIFILGIKGVAMVNLSVILKQMGKQISGVDVKEEFITDYLLQKHHIAWTEGFDIKNLADNIDCFIYSAAHGGITNPLALEAKKRGIPLVSQAEVMGEIMKQFKTPVAVSGCHGKTTTSSLLAYALIELGEKPSYLVGSSSFNDCDGGHYERGNYFVVEADEYGVNPPLNKKPKFLYLNPQHIICTNIDYDHPDVYESLTATQQAFFTFFDKRSLILCGDDHNLMETVKNLARNQYITYGFDKNNDYKISNSKIENNCSSFKLEHKSEPLGLFESDLYGDKNMSNVAAVVVYLHQRGFDLRKINKAIRHFSGAKRRFEKIFVQNDTYLFDDYAHHPEEIKTTVQAARKRFPSRRIILIFQPHTYSRTQSLLNQFAQSLSIADSTLILPIFASARENPREFNIRSEDIGKKMTNNAFVVNEIGKLKEQLRTIVKRQDIIFTMGAGDVYKLKDDIIKVIRSL